MQFSLVIQRKNWGRGSTEKKKKKNILYTNDTSRMSLSNSSIHLKSRQVATRLLLTTTKLCQGFLAIKFILQKRFSSLYQNKQTKNNLKIDFQYTTKCFSIYKVLKLEANFFTKYLLGKIIPLELSQMWRQKNISNCYTLYMVTLYSEHNCWFFDFIKRLKLEMH